MKYKKITFFLLFSILFLILPIIVFGQETEISWPKSPTGIDLTPDSSLGDLVSYAYEWAVSIGGMIVFFILIKSGLEYLFSAGDAGKMGNALKSIKSAVLGLILLLSSYLILNTINPELVGLEIARDVDGIKAIEMDTSSELEPKCDLVVFYEDANYEGSREIINNNYFNKNIKKNILFQPSSVKGFVKCEKDLDGKYHKDCVSIGGNYGYHIEGGSCYVEFFNKDKLDWAFWKTRADCGTRIMSVVPPNNDISYSLYEKKESDCIIIIQN